MEQSLGSSESDVEMVLDLQEPLPPHGTTPDIPKGKGWCPNTAGATDVGGMGAPILPNRTITNTRSGWLWLSLSFESLPSLGFSTLLNTKGQMLCREARSPVPKSHGAAP